MILAAIVISAIYVAWRDSVSGRLGLRTLLAPLLLALVLYALDEGAPQVARALAGAILLVIAVVAVPDLAGLAKGGSARSGPAKVIPFPHRVAAKG